MQPGVAFVVVVVLLFADCFFVLCFFGWLFEQPVSGCTVRAASKVFVFCVALAVLRTTRKVSSNIAMDTALLVAYRGLWGFISCPSLPEGLFL